MIAERPGGVRPTGDPSKTPDTKAAREESKKVERVREIDADEETQRRRRKFQMMMGDEDQLSDVNKEQRGPSPFETQFYTQDNKEAPSTSSRPVETFYSPPAPSSSDVGEDAIVPSPAYSPPPNIQAAPSDDEDEEDELPRSEKFWADTDTPPDMSEPKREFKETNQSQIRAGFQGKEKKETGTTKKEKEIFSPFGVPGKESKIEKIGAGEKEPKMEKGAPLASAKGGVIPSKQKGKEMPPPPFFEKGKEPSFAEKEKGPTAKGISSKMSKPPEAEGKVSARYMSREEERAGLPEEKLASSGKRSPAEKREAEFSLGKKEETRKAPSRKREREEEIEYGYTVPRVQREMEREGEKRGTKEGPTLEIASPSLPHLPASIQPMAMNAATQASPYLSPETIPLYFQMVGQMFIMSAPPGISRTEIVLNNPAFANSKFYGSRITIEKYATAPDSFNIRLTGSDTAVLAFKENIPSLMTAFQNGNFTFRINRLDAEFSIEKPVFRRKEGGEKGKDTGGDLGERRK